MIRKQPAEQENNSKRRRARKAKISREKKKKRKRAKGIDPCNLVKLRERDERKVTAGQVPVLGPFLRVQKEREEVTK